MHNIRRRCFVFTFLHFLTSGSTREAFMVGVYCILSLLFWSPVADTRNRLCYLIVDTPIIIHIESA
jgi:hypothetical protein